MSIKVLLIGGPSTGKTTLLNHLAQLGHPCLEEISREVTKKAQQDGVDQLFLEKPLLFSTLLRDARIAQFNEAQNHNTPFVFIDRGIPDTIAYMDYISQSYPESFTSNFHKYTYDKVFILPPWEAIHTTDDERYESFDQAKKIQEHLINTYKKYNYTPIEVPIGPVEKRADFILNHLSDCK